MSPSAFSALFPAVISLGMLAAIASAQQTGSKPAPSEPAAGMYHQSKSFDVGGDGGWDYCIVGPEGHRLFVSRSTHVMVIDIASGKVVGDIPDTDGVHGIALAPDLGRGFTSNGRAKTVTIFDLATLKPIGSAPTGDNPDAILYDLATKRVFTFNGRSHDATAIDAADGKVVGTIELGGKPEFAVSDGAGKIFVNIEDRSEVVALDSKKLAVLARWPIAPGEEPSGLAFDAEHKRLFSVCGNKTMVVLDCESGKVLDTLAIGAGVDAAAFDPVTGCAFASNGDGTLTVVHEEAPGEFSVIENDPTAPGSRTMALDPRTHIVYLPSAQFGPATEGENGSRRRRPPMVPGSFKILVMSR